MRGLAYTRYQRERHIKRKERFLRKSRTDNPPHKYNDRDVFNISFPRGREVSHEGYWLPYWIVNYRGKLNKGKIHCSCGICSSKTRNKGKRRKVKGGNWSPSINYNHKDMQRLFQMDWEEKHWDNESQPKRELRRKTAILEDETVICISQEELKELTNLFF